MWSVLGELAMLPIGIYYLLLGYRRIGKLAGEDPKYDATYRQWSGAWKFLGWGWIVLIAVALAWELITATLLRTT